MASTFPILPFVFLLFTVSHAREILVGGSANAWKVPEASNNTLVHWAQINRFKVGDFLVWKYDPKVDSVLQVTKEDYESCNTSKPIKEYKDGNTKVVLDTSGPHCFISGAPGNCGKGEKIMVVVLSPNHPPPTPSAGGGHTVPPTASPPKSPAAKSPASSTAASPAPSPANSAAGMLGGGSLLVLMGLASVLALV